MKKIIILPFLFLGVICWGQAQFAVQNGSKTEIYSNINTAISNAANGDTLYIPGGGFSISNTTIDKTLHWVGHGHFPAGTSATMQTRITSPLTFSGNCDNSSFEGIWFTNSLTFGSAGNDTENVKVKRCRISGRLTLRAANTDTTNINFYLSESVLKSDVVGNNASNCLMEKNLFIRGYVYSIWASGIHQSLFKHNVFSYRNKSGASYTLLSGFSSCTFENNIFPEQYTYNSVCDALIFNNNIFSGDFTVTAIASGINNVTNKTDIFVSVADIYTFSYDNDYHISTASGGLNAATDGTNIGIYGSSAPAKDYAIPYYPHITNTNIASEAVNNQLGVSISAQAQSR